MDEFKEMRDAYWAELEKAGNDPVARNSVIFAYGEDAVRFAHERCKEQFDADWRDFADNPIARAHAPKPAAQLDPNDEAAQQAIAAQMEREYTQRYGAIPTNDVLVQAAAGIDPSEFFSEHGRELYYARASKLAGHQRKAEGGRQATGASADEGGSGLAEQVSGALERRQQRTTAYEPPEDQWDVMGRWAARR